MEETGTLDNLLEDPKAESQSDESEVILESPVLSHVLYEEQKEMKMGVVSRVLSTGPLLCEEQLEEQLEEQSKQDNNESFTDDKDVKMLPSCVHLLHDMPKTPIWKRILRNRKSYSFLIQPKQSLIPKDVLLKDSSKMSGAAAFPPKYLPLTFLPDCVIDEVLAGTLRSVPYTVHSAAVLLLADISGFTAFTETYCQVGMYGIEEVISVLNGYLSALAEALMSAGADILSFAGDAFLCQWEEKEEDDMNTIIERAFRCAVEIQNSLKPKSIHRNANLRVKIGIAFGGITTWFVGSPSEFLHFVISGHTLPKVRSAQEICDAGGIVVTSSLWECLKAQNIDVEQYSYAYVGTTFVKITAYGNVKESKLKPFGSGRTDIFKKLSKRHIAMSRAFLIPIIRDLKTKEQLKYLSELAQVTTLFILLPDIDIEEPVDLDVPFDIVLSCVKNFGGVLNKVLLFDKGCTFLAMFGLPGMKHSDDTVRALMSAKNIILTLRTKNIKATIGVSNGFCFCGIVGHPQRQEYTVIGQGVNLAARLAVTYEDQSVVLDAETYYHSRRELGERCFVELEARHLKGLTNVGTLYCYLFDAEDEKKTEESVTEDMESFDIFGMEKERSLLTKALKMMPSPEWSSIAEKGFSPVFKIVGRSGSGKSYLMCFAVETAKTLNYKVLACCSNASQKKIPFLTIAFLIQELVKLKECELAFDRQQRILQYIKDPHLYLLNHLLNVEFPFPHVTVVGDEYYSAEIQRLLKKILLKFCGDSHIVIAIDDANFIDVHSWLFLKNMAEEPNILLVLSLPTNFQEPCLPVFEMLMKAFSVMTLGPLNEELITPVVCQFWGVTAVHKDVVNYLRKHTARSSVQLEEILLHPSVVQAIALTPINEVDGSRLMSDFYHIEQNVAPSSRRSSRRYSFKKSKDVKVCDVAKGASFDDLMIPFKLQDSVKERLNALHLQERLLLKRAAVLGTHFTQSILEDVSPDMSPQEISSSINTLVYHHILETGYDQSEDIIESASSRQLVKVTTPQVSRHPNMTLGKITEHLRFRSSVVRHCILGCMTRHQLNNMNIEIALNLEKHGMLCLSCKRRKANDESQMVQRKDSCQMCSRLLFFPKIDLRECTCPSEKSEKFSFISSCYEKTGLKLIPLCYLVRAAQADIENNNPVKALHLADIALKKFRDMGFIHISSFTGDDRNCNPIVLEASIYRVTGEAKLLLGNTYEGASCALKGLGALETDIFDFFGIVSQVDVMHLSFRYSSKERQELANCLYVACQSYYAAQSFTISYGLAKSYLTMIEFQASFISKIRGGTMFYQCQNKAHPGMNQYGIEVELFLACINRMRMLDTHLSVREINAIGETYLALAKVHLRAGRLERVEEIGFEAYKLLKYVNDFNTTPFILFTLSRSLFYQKKLSKCIEVLNRLKDIAHQSGHNTAYALYCCELMDLLLLRENRATTNDRIAQCMDFISHWAGKCKSLMRTDVAFYTAAKTALWCLREKYGIITDEELAAELFAQWHITAESMMTHDVHTYFDLSALLSMLKIEFATCQDSVVLDRQTKKEKTSSILKETNSLWAQNHRYYPVFKEEVKLFIKDLKSKL